RAGGDGRVLAVPAGVAAGGPARLRLGPALGHPELAARPRELLHHGARRPVSTQSPTSERRPRMAPAPPVALPRLLAGVGDDGPLSLVAHLAKHGPAPRIRGGGRSR